MLPGDRVECKVALPGLEPGRYRAELSIEQSGLQRSTATAEFTVRRAWWVAALWLALGSLVGALFAFWQGSLQRRLFQEAQALDLRSSFTIFERSLDPATQPNTARLAQQAVARLAEIIDELHHGSDADFKEGLNDYAVLLRALRGLAVLEGKLPSPPTAGQSAALDSLLQQLAQKPDANAISGALEKLREELVKPASVVHGFTVNRSLASHIANMLPDTARSLVLKRTATFIQLLFGAISLAFSVFVGVDALWVPSAAWGSLFDITVAILAGIAGTAAGTVSLSTLAQPFAAKVRIAG